MNDGKNNYLITVLNQSLNFMKRSDQIRIIVIFTMLLENIYWQQIYCKYIIIFNVSPIIIEFNPCIHISCTHIMYHMICVHQLSHIHTYIMCKYHIYLFVSLSYIHLCCCDVSFVMMYGLFVTPDIIHGLHAVSALLFEEKYGEFCEIHFTYELKKQRWWHIFSSSWKHQRLSKILYDFIILDKSIS